MTLHDKRRPRTAMVLACGVFSAGLAISCTGTVMDPTEEDDSAGIGAPGGPSNPGGGGGGSVTPPGVGPPPGSDIIPPDPKVACESTEFTPARIWRLSDDQFVAAIRDLVPGANPPSILTPGRSAQVFVDFSELYEIGPAIASDIRASANAVAVEAVKNLDGFLACKTGEAADACPTRFAEDFASRAFRRPLEASEKTALRTLYAEGAKVSRGEGIRMVVSAILQSPSFVYRTELGKTTGPVAAGSTIELTTHELASAVSFLLLNSIPDAELRAAADDGSLAKAEVFKSHIERLLKTPRVQDHLTNVYLKWVGLGGGTNADLAVVEKEFTPALKASMEQEAKLFMRDLLGNGGTVNDILTSNKGFADKVLATHMGVSSSAATGHAPITYPAAERSGVLTLPAVIARYSVGHPEVFRGKFVRDEFLCEEIPPPPPIPEIEEKTKMNENLPIRQQSDARMKDDMCSACHAKMDPLGLSFMHYDAVARFKANDAAGKPVDASGSLEGAGAAWDGPVRNAVELGQKLAKSPVVRTCVESKMLSYALGRMTAKSDSCELQKIDSFVALNGGKLSALMSAVIYSSAFRFRSGGK